MRTQSWFRRGAEAPFGHASRQDKFSLRDDTPPVTRKNKLYLRRELTVCKPGLGRQRVAQRSEYSVHNVFFSRVLRSVSTGRTPAA